MELPIELLGQSIKRGTILLSDSFKDIDHAKFFTIIGVYQGFIAGFFFINSRIHPMLIAKPEQFSMQYQLRKTDYPFLRYDSFVGANELQKRSVSTLAKSMQNGETTIVGQLTDFDLEALLDACRRSELFTPKEKHQFFY